MDSSLREKVEADPTLSEFVEVAEELWSSGERGDALTICLRGVSCNKSAYRGRLLLARMLFELDCISLCVRELKELHQDLPESLLLSRLLEKFGVAADKKAAKVSSSKSEQTVAEADFDLDELAMLEDEEGE